MRRRPGVVRIRLSKEQGRECRLQSLASCFVGKIRKLISELPVVCLLRSWVEYVANIGRNAFAHEWNRLYVCNDVGECCTVRNL